MYNKKRNEKKKTREIRNFWFIILIFFSTAVWFFFPVWINWAAQHLTFVNLGSLEKFGIIGDSFNVINSLFSGIALGAIVVAIFIQNRQLKVQREEADAHETYLKKEDEWHRKKLQFETIPQAIETSILEIEAIYSDCKHRLGYDTNSSKLSGFDRDFYKTRIGNNKFTQLLENHKSELQGILDLRLKQVELRKEECLRNRAGLESKRTELRSLFQKLEEGKTASEVMSADEFNHFMNLLSAGGSTPKQKADVLDREIQKLEDQLGTFEKEREELLTPLSEIERHKNLIDNLVRDRKKLLSDLTTIDDQRAYPVID